MMQMETLNETSKQTPAAEMTRTRCPGCQKLFAIETETLVSMARAGVVRAEFNCTSALCRSAFGIDLPLPVGHSALMVLPAVPLAPVQPEPPAVAPAKSIKPLVRALAKTPSGLLGVSLERECPRCGVESLPHATDCVRCGIIFENYAKVGSKVDSQANDVRLEEELALGGSRDLAALWDKALEDYEDRIRHDRFLNACRDSKALSYAAKKYSQILVAAPQDDIARLMRNRVVALVASQAESSRLPIRLDFRIPKLNSMALFGGALLFFCGLVMPQFKSVMGIGLSLVLLSVGVRLALRSRI